MLGPHDVAFGFISGQRLELESLTVTPGEPVPLMRLEEAMRPALLRPPCLVSFSGGRDSSAVLAVAAHAARREGLALPIPVTARFAWAQSAEETAWQELVVKHLRLPDWELSLTSENTGLLDSVGPVATRGLLRHGALFPHNAHFHTPLLELARGGSLLTGIDGDGLFGSWPWWRAAAVLAGKTAPQPRDLLRVGHALAPASLRRRYSTRRHAQREAPTWLTAPAQLAFARAVTTFSEEPLRWSSHVEAFARRRELAVGSASLSLLADDADALIVHPFLDRAFLSSLKRAGGTSGWGDRTATMTALFGGLLPSSALTRTTKAIFGEVFWSEPSREFARSWDGRGVDTDLVDVEALRAEWLSPSPDGRTGLLLQSAWLHANGRSGAGA